MVRPPLCLAQEPSLTSSAKPSLSGAVHERCSVKTEAGMEPPPSPPLDLYGAGMWERFWVVLWSRRVLVPVLSSHSAQTPKASLSPAFDLQCRKSGRGKFVPLSSGLSPHFGWQRDALSPPHQGEAMPFLLSVQRSFPAGYFGSLLHPWHHEDLRLHQVQGAGSWQSGRSWDL